MSIQNDFLAVLGSTAQARNLTASKTEFLLHRDGGQITGFVITDDLGNVVIVDKSAVRLLFRKEMWWLMHESKSPLNPDRRETASESPSTPSTP